MATITLTDEQVADLVEQLPPPRRLDILHILAQRARQQRDDRMAYAEEQLRRVSAERGLDWESMPEDERERFVDDLLHDAFFDTVPRPDGLTDAEFDALTDQLVTLSPALPALPDNAISRAGIYDEHP